MQRRVSWTGWDGEGADHCVLEEGQEGALIEGAVTGGRGGAHGAFYSISCDASWRTRRVALRYAGGPSLVVEADGEGCWRDMNAGGAVIEGLQDCLDVDIGITPATNTLPIRRLRLEEGEAAAITVAYVPLPSEIDGPFTPRAAAQRYSCLRAGALYRYEGLFRGFSAELEVDRDSLVMDYPDTFRRKRD
jgi:hypothetical protein